ncbi:aldehyde ferredoxin oxidoreductase N-terminal domain-containing protein [Clostridium sp. KNHs214]|nr:aldehyde ferredoxin oxidoreductase N-terminal domain-containing protein [Clostridium sp. KNHs214]
MGTELKNAGYDMIIIEGKADDHVYVNIEDDKVEIRDANHVWGKLSLENY